MANEGNLEGALGRIGDAEVACIVKIYLFYQVELRQYATYNSMVACAAMLFTLTKQLGQELEPAIVSLCRTFRPPKKFCHLAATAKTCTLPCSITDLLSRPEERLREAKFGREHMVPWICAP